MWHGCLHSQRQLWSPAQLLNKCKPTKILPEVLEELMRHHLWVKNECSVVEGWRVVSLRGGGGV